MVIPKVIYSKNKECSYEVYGARERVKKYKNYDREWDDSYTEFLIYYNNSWVWVDARHFEPKEVE